MSGFDPFGWMGAGVHALQQWLFESAVQPLLFAFGLLSKTNAGLLERNGHE